LMVQEKKAAAAVASAAQDNSDSAKAESAITIATPSSAETSKQQQQPAVPRGPTLKQQLEELKKKEAEWVKEKVLLLTQLEQSQTPDGQDAKSAASLRQHTQSDIGGGSEVSSLKELVRSLEDELAKYRSQEPAKNAEWTKERDSLQAKLDSVSKQLTESAGAMKQLEEERKKSQSVARELESLKKTSSEEKETLQKYKNEMEQRTKAHQDAQARIKSLEEELERMKDAANAKNSASV